MLHPAGRALQEEGHDSQVALLGGQVQRQVALVVLHVHVRLELQQSLQRVEEAGPGRVVQDSEAGAVFQIRVGASQQQLPGDLRVPQLHHLKAENEEEKREAVGKCAPSP